MTPALKWAAIRAILMFHNCEGQSQDCPQTTTFKKRKAEADSNRIPSAYLPNALPLGQAGEFAWAF